LYPILRKKDKIVIDIKEAREEVRFEVLKSFYGENIPNKVAEFL